MEQTKWIRADNLRSGDRYMDASYNTFKVEGIEPTKYIVFDLSLDYVRVMAQLDSEGLVERLYRREQPVELLGAA